MWPQWEIKFKQPDHTRILILNEFNMTESQMLFFTFHLNCLCFSQTLKCCTYENKNFILTAHFS